MNAESLRAWAKVEMMGESSRAAITKSVFWNNGIAKRGLACGDMSLHGCKMHGTCQHNNKAQRHDARAIQKWVQCVEQRVIKEVRFSITLMCILGRDMTIRQREWSVYWTCTVLDQ
jgi:hypothetical protein